MKEATAAETKKRYPEEKVWARRKDVVTLLRNAGLRNVYFTTKSEQDQIQGNDVSGAHSTHGKQKKTYKVLVENHLRYRPFVPLSVQCRGTLDSAYRCTRTNVGLKPTCYFTWFYGGPLCAPARSLFNFVRKKFF